MVSKAYKNGAVDAPCDIVNIYNKKRNRTHDYQEYIVCFIKADVMGNDGVTPDFALCISAKRIY